MGVMRIERLEHCLALLRQVDAVLMEERELGTAVHLSLAIERLSERLKAA